MSDLRGCQSSSSWGGGGSLCESLSLLVAVRLQRGQT